MSTELAETRASILTLSEDADPAVFEETRSMLDALKERLRELDEQWKAAALARCIAHGEMLLMGHRRFFAGTEKETKCRDVRRAIEAIYEETGGDFEALCGCLSVNALKPGATKKVLSADRFAETFETTEKTKLKSAEAKEKSLIEVDERFVR